MVRARRQSSISLWRSCKQTAGEIIYFKGEEIIPKHPTHERVKDAVSCEPIRCHGRSMKCRYRGTSSIGMMPDSVRAK